MPRIFDNIEQKLLPSLQESLETAQRADFCVGYFNLRGWHHLDQYVERFAGEMNACCRLMVGMHKTPRESLHEILSLSESVDEMDMQKSARLKKQVAQEFRDQLVCGAPTNEDEVGLQRLSQQLKSGKVVVKLFLRHPLHAKLYLVHQGLKNLPAIGFVGSSNLTLSGLQYQGELNVDVLDHDATEKLQRWFDDRWKDKYCLDISKELIQVIDESWVTQETPYHIYLKIAYHLSQEARTGISEYRIPREFRDRLFEFQSAAVRIAAQHVNKRGGVLIGDVVGLGKTMVGTALAKILQEDSFLETLIICPKNLVPMWEDYVREYRLYAEVLSISKVQKVLPELRRYRVVLIDESHNLRNTDGRRYRAIQEYIAINESKCILLSATPYNKTYLDLSAQLKLFIPEDRNLGIRPEQLIQSLGGTEGDFTRKHQVPIRSLRAFELSEFADDWRDLMRLYMVRRTRSFIKDHYAQEDEVGKRYLQYQDGSRAYFPTRIPRTAKFAIGSADVDPYARLYSDSVVRTINALNLPRYGLGNYLQAGRKLDQVTLSDAEKLVIAGLSRAGRRLMGFCRTNLFKRLESSGVAFIQSLERHVLRNYIYLHAIEHNLEIPIGPQDASLLDTRTIDEDSDSLLASLFDIEVEETDGESVREMLDVSEIDYKNRATEVYQEYAGNYRRRFKWIRSSAFTKQLGKDLLADAKALIVVLKDCGEWERRQDGKLMTLLDLLQNQHLDQKVLVFTQFADTARYLESALRAEGVDRLAIASGESADPTEIAWRFSPGSNGKNARFKSEDEYRVLIATDVLSEGQNLQDCAIVVNYDLPWAIIRLIQRAGRVDRIGQQSEEIICYSFLPAEGVDRLINLRGRLQQRLAENAEVVGTDEAFFEGVSDQVMLDLYNEKSGILDEEDDSEVDLTSEAFQIWSDATKHHPALKKQIENLQNVVYSTRAYSPQPMKPEGVLMYMRTSEGNDALAWVDRDGKSVTQSQLAILRMAACTPGTPAIERDDQHHALVKAGTTMIVEDETQTGGKLGRKSGAKYRAYDRLKRYVQENPLLQTIDLAKAIDDLYNYPLYQSAADTLNRQLKSGIDDVALADLVVALRMDDRLCIIQEELQQREPQIICSLGLFQEK
jgi:Helicase conserved C-terminal domain/PLD-like domain/SNF2-related domain